MSTIDENDQTAVAAVTAPVAAKLKTKGSRKKRRFRPSRSRSRIGPELRRFWRWEEHYNTAVDRLIQSLAVGRKISAKALVKLAADIADEALAVHDKRRARAGVEEASL